MFFRNEPTCYKNCFVETPIRFPKWPFPIAPSGMITLTTFLLFDDFFHPRRVAETSVEKRDFKNTAAEKSSGANGFPDYQLSESSKNSRANDLTTG